MRHSLSIAASGKPGWYQALQDMRRLDRGWDGYDAEPPTYVAIAAADHVIGDLARTFRRPDRVAPSVVGGVGITYRQGGRRVYIECFNEGGIYALFSDGEAEPYSVPVDRGALSVQADAMREYLSPVRNP